MSTAPTDAPSVSLARETRERFVIAVERVIASVVMAVREWLMTQTAQAGGREAHENRDDFVVFREHASNWVGLVQDRLRGALDAGGAPAASSTTATGALQLELIGDEEIENGILASRLALAIEDKAGLELNDLRLRIQHLEGREELAAKDVLRPDVLARVLVDSWVAVGLGRPLWNKVQAAMRNALLDAIAAAYRDANAFLVDRGVMREIDLKGFVRRAQGMPSSAQGVLTAGTGAGRGAAAPSDGAPMVSPLTLARQRAQSVIGNLRRFVSARIGGDFAVPRVGDAASTAGLRLPGSGAAVSSQTFAAAIAEAEAACRLAASQYVAGDVIAGTERAILDVRRRTGELKRKAPTTADKATVEIVALMFQAILVEERIPFSVRVWFARLQMPVLRVALAEPEFFGSLQHPARMLIDRMGACVMGFDAAAISGSALEGEIRRVVQVIEQYPETGRRVFKLVYDEFCAFLSKYLTQGDATQRLTSIAQQVEQKETMAVQYTIELRKMLDDMPVPEPVRDFLFKVWAEVLALAALRYGAQDAQTAALKRAAADLVWAAGAKPQREERARVIQALPDLLQRLRQGMALLGITGEPQDEHVRTLGTILADAFMSKTGVIPSAQIDAMVERLANLEAFFGDAEGAALPLDAASIELLLGVDAASIEVIPDTDQRVEEDMLAWAHELQVGSWFLLDHNDRASQVQFVWRSEHRQLHLFVGADGHSFLIQAGRLASYLQAGLLVPAEEEALTVRATREALAKLDANPERLLG